jgi:anaerobic selenocysteine-containing dehydrogenase
MRAGLPDRRADARHGAGCRSSAATARTTTPRSNPSAPSAAWAARCRLKVKDGKIKYVEGIDGPANEGRLCVKGRFGFDYIHHPHRLTKPLIRRADAPPKG